MTATLFFLAEAVGILLLITAGLALLCVLCFAFAIIGAGISALLERIKSGGANG
jgi:hypothetical protein